MQLTTRELVEKFGSHRLIVLDDDILADFDDDTVLLLSAQKPTKKSILPEIAKYANFLKMMLPMIMKILTSKVNASWQC